MVVKEYRICMPLTVEEYKLGQLYMIARHSHEQSEKGDGVEVVRNEPITHDRHGEGMLTEKRIHLSSKLPAWIKAFVPNLFYITETSSNFYPYTSTEYTCSFLPRFSINIDTKYENNNGTTDNCHNLDEEALVEREVDNIDIAFDPLAEHHYKKEEDLRDFKSKKTQRGPLEPGWSEDISPIMCSYKVVNAKLEIWGLQTRGEAFAQKTVREILLLGHRQAVAWIDDWIDMGLDEIRSYEEDMHKATNQLVVTDDAEPDCGTTSSDALQTVE